MYQFGILDKRELVLVTTYSCLTVRVEEIQQDVGL